MLFDGAFGTYHAGMTRDAGQCELACLSAPQTVEQIHRAYLEAGAQARKTNTFAANPQTILDMEPLRLSLRILGTYLVSTPEETAVLSVDYSAGMPGRLIPRRTVFIL